jgi:hypothetical protein
MTSKNRKLSQEWSRHTLRVNVDVLETWRRAHKIRPTIAPWMRVVGLTVKGHGAVDVDLEISTAALRQFGISDEADGIARKVWAAVENESQAVLMNCRHSLSKASLPL